MGTDVIETVALSSLDEATVARRTRTEVEWLVDNDAAYVAFVEAIRRARSSICISQLAFDVDCEAYVPDGPVLRIFDEVVHAWRTHALDVRILLNETLLVDTAKPLRRAFAANGAEAVEVRGISRFPQLLHAKILIVDDREAFLIGSPFVNGYWDDSSHRPDDPRRTMRELGGRPLHDLSVRLEGSVVARLQDAFDMLWSDADSTPTDVKVRVAPSAESSPIDAGVVVRLTTPRCAENVGRKEILPAMLRGIASARELIYIEHQYLSSRRVVAALANALERHPQLEIIALVNQNPDVTAYRGWQNQRLAESGLSHHARFGLFALWTRKADCGRLAVNQVFVHSKVIIADDCWATVGSANIDGVSLHSYGADFSSALGGRIFRNVRNFDANIELHEGNDGDSSSIRELRTRLWDEHLGALPQARPARGWLSLWRTRVDANVNTLNGDIEDNRVGPFILSYSDAPTPAAQLRSLGVVDREELDLRFRPSWLEVYCSPNWIRNMFA